MLEYSTQSTFSEVVSHRRSNYAIGKAVKDDASLDVRQILEFALQNTPSAFNSQPAQLLLLEGAAHDRLWTIVQEAFADSVKPESYAKAKPKIDSFAAGWATILFFIDTAVTDSLIEQFPTYAHSFPNWARESTGMLQYVIWDALDDAGFGVSLQHYNPLIDRRVSAEWNIPAQWALVSQMVFGSREADPLPKTFIVPNEHLQLIAETIAPLYRKRR
ncbi:MAG: nitroreductase family protein [Actinomycetes bacterium]|jgi:predicted oxidoreductase (fatty acid repression mutant protein)|nr:nitroreductase family protein [Actinomycetes bacterium]